MESYINITNANITFGSYKALNSVDFDLHLGEVHCLAGTNGSGKSTLVKIISGVYQPDNKETIIKINGYSYENLMPSEAIASGIQVIFQDLSLFDNLTVRENIAFHYNLISPYKLVSKKDQAELANRVLASLNVSLDIELLVESLSVAFKQIVAIARALATNAKVLFMDEPTASLTQKEVSNLLNIVRKLKKDNMAIVFISHKLDEVLSVSDRVTVLRDAIKIGTYPAEGMNDLKLSELMTNTSYSYEKRNQQFTSDSKVILEVKNISRAKEYKDISFTVKEGEVLGIGGLMGAGRTEVALSIFGLSKVEKGEIIFDGAKFDVKSNIQAIEKGIAYVSEDRLGKGVILDQSVSDNMSLPILKSLINKLHAINFIKKNDIISHYKNHMNVKTASLDLPISSLSGGNQQKAVLGKWLAINPKLIIFDNPSIGVDIEAKMIIYKEINELSKKGIAVILISDEIPELFYNSDRIIIMKSGSIFKEVNTSIDSMRKVQEIINEC